MMRQTRNVGPLERWISVLTGVALIRASLGRRAPVARLAAAGAGLFFVARGASSFCVVKSVLQRRSFLGERLNDRWSRARAQLSARRSAGIDTLERLYLAELQELHSAETQLCSLLADLSAKLQDATLARQLGGYATEVGSRCADLARVLRDRGLRAREHTDQAMRALLLETRKVAHVPLPNLRDAALLSSLQRALHFKIAGYGTVAAYASQLGRTEEAAQLAQYAGRDKQLDAKLTEMAATLVNPRAYGRTHPAEGWNGERRTRMV